MEPVAAAPVRASDAHALHHYRAGSPLRRPLRFVRSMVVDALRSRELAISLFRRDLRTQYRQSLMGYFWAVLPPLATAAVFIFLNRQSLLSAGEVGVPYPVYVLSGMFFWQFFVELLQSPLKAVGAARHLLTKVNFPREALLLAGVGEVLFNTAVRALVILPLLLWAGLGAPHSLGWLLAAWLALGALGLTLGLLVAPLGMLYGDVGRGLSLVVNFWFFLTPVVYAPGTSAMANLLNRFNPVTPLLSMARHGLHGGPADPAAFGLVALSALVGGAVAWIVFRLALPRIVERLGG